MNDGTAEEKSHVILSEGTKLQILWSLSGVHKVVTLKLEKDLAPKVPLWLRSICRRGKCQFLLALLPF